ncbi:MAG: tetratricopeptide repeat protein [Terriglobales bacterium]
MAETLQKRHRFEEAATAFAQAADVYRHTDPLARSKLASSLELQEMNLQLAGKNEEAKQIHPAVLAAAKEGNTSDPRGVMMSFRSRALEARKNGNVEEESQLIAQEVAASQKLSTWDQIVALTDSAMIHQEQQKLPEAETELKQVLELSIASTGSSSRATAEAHIHLGGLYLTSHRLGEAEESYAAALALFGAHETDELKMAFTQLGYAYLQEGKFDRAEAAYQRSVKLAEDTHDDAALSGALQYLAMLYQKTNRPADAEAALTRALNISAQLPKPMNRQWAGAAMMAASFYEQSGRPQQAEQLYGRLITFLEQEVGADSPALRLPLDKLISLLKSQGRLAEAAKYEARRDKLPQMPAMPGLAH